jgi:hypothetical protein
VRRAEFARQVLEALRRLHDPLSHAFGTGSAARHEPLEELAAPEPAPDSDTAMSGVRQRFLPFGPGSQDARRHQSAAVRGSNRAGVPYYRFDQDGRMIEGHTIP